MAISKSFFGLRKKSTKSHTYSIYEGKQVTKDRVTEVKNPRTSGQMKQRAIMSSVLAGYSAMKSIVDHSWQGVTYGAQSMNYFYKTNLDYFRSNLNAVSINAYKNKSVLPSPFRISKGTLKSWTDGGFASIDADEGKIAVAIHDKTYTEAGGFTVADFLNTLGISSNGYFTLVGLFGDGENEYNGVTQLDQLSFIWKRYHVATGEGVPTAIKSAADFSNSFDVESNAGDGQGILNFTVAVSFVADTSSWNVVFTAAANRQAVGAISSDIKDGSWLRSTESILVDGTYPNAGLTYENAIKSYPTGKSYILNGGDD